MNILLVSATTSEIEPLLSHFKIIDNGAIINGHTVKVVVTGVGMTATAFALGTELANYKYDLAINIGIAGAFDRSVKIGEVVCIGLDCFAELGAEDGEDFISIEELGFGKSGIRPVEIFQLPILASLKKVKSITVNKVHGNDESIYNTVTRLNPQTESMEGAAFYYACNQTNTPCIQLRGISNYIERRNRSKWDIPLAIKNVNETVITLLTNLA
ncbi:MAG: futalosine hydrolase [Pyrinomonadaceae bacterium]|nr:futalosine hydrolase [Sphingobacteriaceae bacterium]